MDQIVGVGVDELRELYKKSGSVVAISAFSTFVNQEARGEGTLLPKLKVWQRISSTVRYQKCCEYLGS
jgi:hypothetical protein